MTVRDLAELDLTYAPPFSSAKGPVNYAGFVACNVIDGRVRQCFWDEIDGLAGRDDCFLVDVRSPAEFEAGSIEGSTNIPVDEIRRRIGEIPKDRKIVLICHSALRSYIACRILVQKGYECCHLSGGYRLYASVMKNSASGPKPDPKRTRSRGALGLGSPRRPSSSWPRP